MLLQQLERDAERIVGNLPPRMYVEKPVRWVVDLDAGGMLLGFVATTGDGGPKDRGKRLMVPSVKRTSGVLPILFADTKAYTFGQDPEDSRAADKHAAYLALVRKCASDTGSSLVRAVLEFLEGGVDSAFLEPIGKPELITFRVEGRLLVEESAVRQFWAEAVGVREGGDTSVGMCLVCGRRAHIPPMMPVPVKGVPGGQSAGMSLVGANSDVFESFGLVRGATCGVCHSCGERFGLALDGLLRDEKSRLVIGPVVYLFWTKEDVSFNPVGFLSSPQPQDVRLLLDSYRSGRKPSMSEEDAKDFHCVVLSANGGRVVVRDWISTSVGVAKRNLAEWFALTAQVDAWGVNGEPLGLYRLASAPYRDATKQMSPLLPGVLVRAALQGHRPLPPSLLALVLARCRAGPAVVRGRRTEVVTYAQAALLKAVLASMDSGKEDYMSELDVTDTTPAYLCGRLLRILEAIQERAIPGINSTVVDKFFGSASTAPATVFGKLLSDAQPHLSKLRKSSEPTYRALERRLEEVMAPLDGFPSTLSMREQALFSLGYYHQRAADRAAAKASKEKALAADATETEE